MSSASNNLDLSGLVRLCHHRWTIPLVAALGPTGGDRFAVLARRLGVARETLKRALEAARAQDLVVPNPGYGHPLRPEYLLTNRGGRLAPVCVEVVRRSGGERREVAARKWSLPVLAAVAAGWERFSEIEEAVGSSTPRALIRALDELEEAGWVGRELVDERPPRPRYRITRSGRPLGRAARALADVASAS